MLKSKHNFLYRIFLAALFPSLSFAQSAMVSTQNESAQNCYQTATSVSSIEDFEISSNIFEPCNVALIELGLSDEDRAATFVNRGILHAASGSLSDALADYEEALSLHSSLGQVYINRGFLYHFEEQLNLALDDYNRALELDIQNKHMVYFARGIVYEEKNLWDEALRDYRKALEHSPDWIPAKTRLQRVLDRIETLNYAIVYNP